MSSSDVNVDSVTWLELKKKYGLGRPAQNCYLRGRVSYVDRANWKVVPNIRVCDATGESEGAVFFYLSRDKNKDSENSSDVDILNEIDAINLGDEIVIREPQLHFFADGQKGIRIDDSRSIVSITRAAEVTSTDQLQYAQNITATAQTWIKRKEYDRAVDNLSSSRSLLSALIQSTRSKEIMNNTSNTEVICNSHLEEYLFLMLKTEWLTCMCHSKEKKYAEVVDFGEKCCNAEKYKVFLHNENNIITGSNSDNNSNKSDWAEKCNQVKDWLEAMVKMTCEAYVQLRQYKAGLIFVTKWRVHLPQSKVLVNVQEQLRREVNAEGKGFELLLRKRKDEYRLQGMGSRFGHQSNLFGNESNSKVTKGQEYEEQQEEHLASPLSNQTKDYYKVNDAATALANVHFCDGVNERCRYKRELLYVMECTSAQAFHMHWAEIQRVKRIKTFILLNTCDNRHCLGSTKEWSPHTHYITMQALPKQLKIACNKQSSWCTALRSSMRQWMTGVCNRLRARQWKCTTRLEDAELYLQSIPANEAVCISLQLPAVAGSTKENSSLSVLPSSFTASSRQWLTQKMCDAIQYLRHYLPVQGYSNKKDDHCTIKNEVYTANVKFVLELLTHPCHYPVTLVHVNESNQTCHDTFNKFTKEHDACANQAKETDCSPRSSMEFVQLLLSLISNPASANKEKENYSYSHLPYFSSEISDKASKVHSMLMLCK